MRTVAHYVLDSLLANGIDTLYCLPGVQLDPFMDAIYDQREQLSVVHTRHEQTAAYMGMGAALATGKPQAYSVVPGAGFLNSTAALSTALSVNARLLAIVAEIPLEAQGSGYGVLHEIPDGNAILAGLTRHAVQIERAESAAVQIDGCFKRLLDNPPGPVGLAVPVNRWQLPVDKNLPSAALNSRPASKTDNSTDLTAETELVIEKAAELLKTAEAPLIVVGGGALDASPDIRALAERLQAPVVAFRNGHGVMPADHNLHLSMPSAYALWPKVDLVIGLGARLHTQLTGWGTDSKLRIIHNSIDPTELGRIKKPDVGICADAGSVARELLKQLDNTSVDINKRSWLDTIESTRTKTEAELRSKLAQQYAWLQAIRDAVPRDGIVVDEITQMGYVGRFGFPVYEPRTYITPGFQATLGYGFATALGVAHARRDVPVVNYTGDGGALYTLNELSTAVKHDIPLTTIVFVDGHFGNVRGFQRDNYNERYIATDLHNPDFVKFAESFGVTGMRADTPDKLRTTLSKAIDSKKPTLIEVPVGEFYPPWEFILTRKLRDDN